MFVSPGALFLFGVVLGALLVIATVVGVALFVDNGKKKEK